MFAPKVSLGGLRDRTVEYTTGKENSVFAQSFHCNRALASNLEEQSCSVYSTVRPATPLETLLGAKQCLRPKVSLSLGGCGIVRLSILHGTLLLRKMSTAEQLWPRNSLLGFSILNI